MGNKGNKESLSQILNDENIEIFKKKLNGTKLKKFECYLDIQKYKTSVDNKKYQTLIFTLIKKKYLDKNCIKLKKKTLFEIKNSYEKIDELNVDLFDNVENELLCFLGLNPCKSINNSLLAISM
jgi:hypothetical protein